ncbi:MAG: hypothetical protein SOX61_10670 [Prevotella sp.]|nr:hypothetical protein [Prevotella sp.]
MKNNSIMELAASTKLPMRVLVMAENIEPLTRAMEMGYVVCDGNGGATWMLGSKTLLAYFLGRVWASDFPNVKRGGGTPVWAKGKGVFPAKALERIFDETNIKELRQGRLYSNVPDGYRIVDRLFITLQ